MKEEHPSKMLSDIIEKRMVLLWRNSEEKLTEQREKNIIYDEFNAYVYRR